MLGPGLCFQKGPFKTKKNEGRYKGQTLSGNANRDQWMHPQMFPFHPIQPSLPTPTRMSSIVEPFNPEQMKQKFTPNRPIGATSIGAPRAVQSMGDYSGAGYNTSPDMPAEGGSSAAIKEESQEPVKQEVDSVVHSAATHIQASEEQTANMQSQLGVGQQMDPANAQHYIRQQSSTTLDMLDALAAASTDSVEHEIINRAKEDFMEIQYQSLESSPSVMRRRNKKIGKQIVRASDPLGMAETLDEVNVLRTERSAYGAHIEHQQEQLHYYNGLVEQGANILQDMNQKLSEVSGNRDAAYAERSEVTHQMEMFKRYMSNYTFIPRDQTTQDVYGGTVKKRKKLLEQSIHTEMIEQRDRARLEPPTGSREIIIRSKGGVVKGGITGRI